MNWSIKLLKKTFLRLFLKPLSFVEFLISIGSKFHIFIGAETEKERSKTDVRDLRTAGVPFDDDLR